MSVTKVKDGYLVRRVVDGRDYRRIAPTRKLADELDVALSARRLRMQFGLPQDKPRLVFEDWWEQWLELFQSGQASKTRPKPQTVARYIGLRGSLRAVERLWLDEVTRDSLENMCSLMPPDKAYKVCAVVKRVLRGAHDRGYLIDEGVLRASVAKPRPRQQIALSWDEVERIAGECPDHVQRGVLFLALTGLRVSEFCNLTDADVGDGFVYVRESKTDAGRRQVYLCAHAAQIVREQQLARKPGVTTLFPTSTGSRYTKDTFRRVLQRAAIRAGVAITQWDDEGRPCATDVHPHSLRSSYVTLSAQAGVPFEIVKEQVGWSDTMASRMWPIYRRVANWERPKAVRLLDGFLGEQREEAVQ